VNQLIIGMDANKDVRTGATEELFRAAGMKEAILVDKHKALIPPATHNMNNKRQPIQGI
jgi:hypothetical protein